MDWFECKSIHPLYSINNVVWKLDIHGDAGNSVQRIEWQVYNCLWSPWRPSMHLTMSAKTPDQFQRRSNYAVT